LLALNRLLILDGYSVWSTVNRATEKESRCGEKDARTGFCQIGTEKKRRREMVSPARLPQQAFDGYEYTPFSAHILRVDPQK